MVISRDLRKNPFLVVGISDFLRPYLSHQGASQHATWCKLLSELWREIVSYRQGGDPKIKRHQLGRAGAEVTEARHESKAPNQQEKQKMFIICPRAVRDHDTSSRGCSNVTERKISRRLNERRNGMHRQNCSDSTNVPAAEPPAYPCLVKRTTEQ